MKIRAIICGLFAIAAVAACKPEEAVEAPELNVDKESVSLAAEAGEASVNVTSNQDWTASADADWVSVEPASGKASEEAVAVKITAEDNPSEEVRTATVTIAAGELTKTISVTQEGAEPEPVTYTIDGKQWITEVDGLQMLVDLGLYEEGAMVVALPAMDGNGFAMYMLGMYTIESQSNASGTIAFAQYDYEMDEFMESIDILYESLTATSVNITCESLFGIETPVAFTAVETPYEINMDGFGGGEPSGSIENGTYWFIEPTNQKVMTPLGENQSGGNPAAVDATNGASTAQNAFTLTYIPDESLFTIQDSYGRYLCSPVNEDGTPARTLGVSASLPSYEAADYYNHLWNVFDKGDGTYEVYNGNTYYCISYSPSAGNWELYDSFAEDFANLFPTLVKAE